MQERELKLPDFTMIRVPTPEFMLTAAQALLTPIRLLILVKLLTDRLQTFVET